VNEMAEKITSILINPELANKFSQNGRQTILDEFSLELAQQIFWEHFSKVYDVPSPVGRMRHDDV